jgi:seryl-tRNA synthetase
MRKLLIFSLFLTGCLSERKLAETCAEKYPIKEEIKEILVIDTIQSKPDTILVHFKDSILPVICPPSKTITLTKEVIRIQENTARIQSLKLNHQKEMESLHMDYQRHEEAHIKEVEKLKKQLDNTETKLQNVKKYKLWFWLLISSLVAIFAIRNSWLKFPL